MFLNDYFEIKMHQLNSQKTSQCTLQDSMETLFNLTDAILHDHFKGANYICGPSLESFDLAYRQATYHQVDSPFNAEEVLSLESTVALIETIQEIEYCRTQQHKTMCESMDVVVTSLQEQLTTSQDGLSTTCNKLRSIQDTGRSSAAVTVSSYLANQLHVKGSMDLVVLSQVLNKDIVHQLLPLMEHYIVSYNQLLQSITHESTIETIMNSIYVFNKTLKEYVPNHVHRAKSIGNSSWKFTKAAGHTTQYPLPLMIDFKLDTTKRFDESITVTTSNLNDVDSLIKSVHNVNDQLLGYLNAIGPMLTHMNALETRIQKALDLYCTDIKQHALTDAQSTQHHKRISYLQKIAQFDVSYQLITSFSKLSQLTLCFEKYTSLYIK